MAWFRIGAAALFLSMTMAPKACRAEQPKGCAALKWPLEKEAGRLAGAGKVAVMSSGTAKADGTAYDLHMVELEEARLPQPPEHQPKMTPSTAGFLSFAAPVAAGAYQIVVSQGAWIDVLQDGRYVKPNAFSGAADCPGARKSMRFDLALQPFVIQISGTTASSMSLLVEPVHQ